MIFALVFSNLILRGSRFLSVLAKLTMDAEIVAGLCTLTLLLLFIVLIKFI